MIVYALHDLFRLSTVVSPGKTATLLHLAMKAARIWSEANPFLGCQAECRDNS